MPVPNSLGEMIKLENEVEQLKKKNSSLFDHDVLNILNGQVMFEEFRDKQLMGDSDYVPFNEAMCVHSTTRTIFDHAFIRTRASGHNESVENYRHKVIEPLTNLFKKKYNSIVLWFGEDMFCQMNLLTILGFLEQSRYKGKVFLNSFRDGDDRKVTQTELILGSYSSVYEDVLVNHIQPTTELFPVMNQAIGVFLDMQTERNAVTTYISAHKHLPTSDLLQRLFEVFPEIGYGDSQYLELIERMK